MGQKQSIMGLKQSIMGGNSEPVRDSAAAAAHTPSGDAASKVKQPQAAGGKRSHPSPFDRVPSGVTRVINSFLNTKDLMRSTGACRLFNANIKSRDHELQLTQRLLSHVVRGEQVEAEALLAKNPRLLLSKTGNTFDHSGRSINGLSAWQAALCAGDAEMLAMMKPYFDSIRVTTKEPNGDTAVISGEHIRLEQTQQIFPEDFEAHVAEQAAAETVFNFRAIVEAINEATEDQLASAINLEGAVLPATDASPEPMTNAGAANDLTKALNAFRQAFTTHSLQEKMFNPQHLLRALESYVPRYDDMSWSNNQCQVFWSQVVGFTQRFMPACYAQALVQGLFYLTKESEPEVLRRSLNFRFGDGKIFSNVGGGMSFLALGFKFGARLGGPAGVGRAGDAGWLRVSTFALIFKKYVKQKQATLRTYARIRVADPASTLVALSR